MRMKKAAIMLAFGLVVTACGITSAAEENKISGMNQTVTMSMNADAPVVKAEESGGCGKQGDNVKWKLDAAGVLTIYGKGEMKNYTSSPWMSDDEDNGGYKVKKVVVKEGVTSIGAFAFASGYDLTSVELPDTLERIEKSAFADCNSLKKIRLSKNLNYIGKDAFYWCSRLTSVKLPEKLSYIGDYAFYWCGLTSVQMPDSVKKMGRSAFGDCARLEKVRISSGLKELNECTFYYCKSLTEVEIPEGIRKIGDQAFQDCKGLKKIVIPNSVKEIVDGPEGQQFRGTENVTIYCKENSYAHSYALSHDIPCVTEEVKAVTANMDKVVLKKKQSTEKLKLKGLASGDKVVSWKSGNTKLVKIDKKGKLTAQNKTGKTFVTATLSTGKKVKVNVTVQSGDVRTSKISGVAKNLTLKKGKQTTLKPVLAPLTSTDKIVYATSDKKVATVDKKGKITAKKKGKAVITVKSGKVTVKCKVTVVA